MTDASADTMAAVSTEKIETSEVSTTSSPAASVPPPEALPASTFPLTSAAKFLYSHQQRERSETTDDGISPYLLQRRKFYQTEEWQRLLAQLAATRTLYVGNLSFYTSEEQLWCFFSQCGRVERVIMGLNERSMTPCGFCFVEYSSHSQALDCQRQLSGMMCDERTIRADLDPVSSSAALTGGAEQRRRPAFSDCAPLFMLSAAVCRASRKADSSAAAS